MAIIKKDKKEKVLVRMRREGNNCAQVMGLQISTATMENIMEVPQKFKNKTTI